MKRLPLVLLVVLVVTSVGLWLAWSPPGANDLVSGDEGYYGTMARNVLSSPRYLVSPSQWPEGVPGDKPPLYPALLALSLRLFGVGEAAVRGPSFLLAAITLLACAYLLRKAAGPWIGLACAALLASLPWFADASRSAAAEIPTTTLGVLALACLAANPAARWRAWLAGVLLGLGFLFKLWLVAPFVLACVALLGLSRERAGQQARLLAGAALAGALHLAAVLALAPDLAGHWLHIYFGRSLAERVGGSGYAGGWVKHPAYYGAILVHAFALVLPLSVAGVEVALRRFREPVPRAVLVWAACVLLLSAFSVKSGVYAYVVVPAWISLAALGAGALARGVRPSLVTLAAGLAASAPWLVPDVAGPRLGGAIWGAVWAACLAAWFVSSRRPAWGPRVAVALVAAVTLGGFVREAQRLPIRYHVPGYRVLAATVDSLVAGVPPGRACFVSPEAPALSFYLFRSGDYWSTPSVPPSTERSAAMKRDTSLRVFVVDSSRQLYGGSMEPAMIAWLEDSTVEITAPFRARLGHDTPLRVFRR